MKKKVLSIFALSVLLIGVYAFMPKATGSHPSSTGAPGEGTCASAGCHSDATVNAGDLANTHIVTDTSGANVSSYIPGDTYTISISVTDANSSKFGFQITSLDQSDNFIGNLVVTNSTRTQLQPNSDPSSLNRQYITHTFSGNSQVAAGLGAWEFDWTAPSVSSGDITFYYATNATNSNGQNTGDVLYLSSFTLTDATQPNNIVEIDQNSTYNVKCYSNGDLLNVSYDLAEGNSVMLKLLDVNGRYVTSINEGFKDAGNYNSKLVMPSSVSNGVYFMTIFIGNKTITEKVVIR